MSDNAVPWKTSRTIDSTPRRPSLLRRNPRAPLLSAGPLTKSLVLSDFVINKSLSSVGPPLLLVSGLS